jgi:hypothetical protein
MSMAREDETNGSTRETVRQVVREMLNAIGGPRGEG